MRGASTDGPRHAQLVTSTAADLKAYASAAGPHCFEGGCHVGVYMDPCYMLQTCSERGAIWNSGGSKLVVLEDIWTAK
jgi:hypothetical protein